VLLARQNLKVQKLVPFLARLVLRIPKKMLPLLARLAISVPFFTYSSQQFCKYVADSSIVFGGCLYTPTDKYIIKTTTLCLFLSLSSCAELATVYIFKKTVYCNRERPIIDNEK
jgi:hypothetical protein